MSARRASSQGPSEDQIEAAPAPEVIHVQPKSGAGSNSSPGSSFENSRRHGLPELVGNEDDNHQHTHYSANGTSNDTNAVSTAADAQARMTFFEHLRAKRHGWFAYLKTREFWIVLVLGQILSLCLTSTNTFSSLLANEGNSIPAFQTLFNYVLLNIVYTSYTVYRYGFKGWLKLLWKDGWRYFILAFCDVEGNYFVVLAYRYTTILSAQLIDFWAIAIVVVISLIFLHVRYHITQYVGILICLGGLGILLASDHITGADSTSAPNELKGDLFCLLGATFYGFTNVFEEFLVSKRPLYEVVGQIGFWGMFINGVQAAIFDRASFASAHWVPAVGGYMTGYTLILALFYSLAPICFRMSSAAFFNISLLTSDFWGVIIGIHVFHLHVHYLYPIAFVCIILGLVVYFVTEGVMGEAQKPWLGKEQEKGVSGVGTAKRKAEREGLAAVEAERRHGSVAESQVPVEEAVV